MNLGRCPVCHCHLDLEAIVQDDCARELLALLAGCDADLARAVIGYLGLWRPAKQDLRWDRALRLAREVLALEPNPQRLAWSLAETVEALRSKGGQMPLKSHGYLMRVLGSAPASIPQPAACHERRASSRTSEAMRRLVEGA
jgi:hypothetical protein